jgi:nucleoside-diphosphate-sugar epimerase
MPTVVIKPGATVFVTGANGLIGSHIVDQLLMLGYNVRGAVRDVVKAQWLKEYFDRKYGDAKFEMVEVPDITVEGCYDNLLQGKAAFDYSTSAMIDVTL